MNNLKANKIQVANEVYIIAFVLFGIVMLSSGYIWLGIVQLILSLVVFLLNVIFKLKHKKQIDNMIESVTLSANTRNDALLSFPLPIILLDAKGSVVWYNKELRQIFSDKNLAECVITDLFSDFDISVLSGSTETTGFVKELEYNGKTFRAIGNTPQSNPDSDDAITILYLEDMSQMADLRKKYIAEKPLICFITVDNYDELMASAPSSIVPQLQSELFKTINDWVSENNGIILKYEKDK